MRAREALADASDGEQALRDARLAALARARAAGLPTRADEDWKYTDVSALAGLAFALPDEPPAPAEPVALPALATLDAHCLVFVNGRHVTALSHLGELPAGLGIGLLQDVARTDPISLADRVRRQGGDPAPVFTALNAAALRDGADITVAAGLTLDRPLLVLFLNAPGAGPRMTAASLRVQAGANSRVTLIEMHAGSDSYFSNCDTRIETAEGAEVAHYRVVDEASDATHIGRVALAPGRDARIENFSLALAGRLVRVDIDCALAAPGAAVVLNGVFLADGDRHVDHHTRIVHAASHTRSEQSYRGIADDRGRGVFNGRIIVNAGVAKVDATQSSHNLLLSSEAEIDTKPELEIYADDLRCAHGATVGQLDEDALFYLRSRGVPAAEARALLTRGFVQALLETLPVRALREFALQRLVSGPLLAEDIAFDPVDAEEATP